MTPQPLAAEATLPLPLPPPSWHRAAVAAHKAALALHDVEARDPQSDVEFRAQFLDYGAAKVQAVDALRVLGAALDDHGHPDRKTVWDMCAAVDFGRQDVDLVGYVAWLEGFAAGGEVEHG